MSQCSPYTVYGRIIPNLPWTQGLILWLQLKNGFLKGTQHKESNVDICKFTKKKSYESHFRSQVNLHQHLCPETVTECSDGLWNISEEKKYEFSFNGGCQEHFALQSNETIKLKQSISNNVRNQKYNSNAKKTVPSNQEIRVRKERGVQRKIRTS